MVFLIILFRLIQMLSGLIFLFRMLSELHLQKLIDEATLTKIGTFLFILFLAIGSVPMVNEVWRWSLFVTSIGSVVFVIKYFVFHREKLFQEKLIFCLDRLIVSLRTGIGLKTALDKIVESESGFEKAKLTQIRSFVVFSQHKNKSLNGHHLMEIIQELRVAQSKPHESMRRIGNLRRKLKIERDFRRRSGQILFQTRIQSWILAGLYLALLIFVSVRDGSDLHFPTIFLSIITFLVGLVWTHLIGKRIRWKI